MQFIQLNPLEKRKTAQKTVGLGLSLAELSLISVIIANLFCFYPHWLTHIASSLYINCKKKNCVYSYSNLDVE